jgi:hypothetical protein
MELAHLCQGCDEAWAMECEVLFVGRQVEDFWRDIGTLTRGANFLQALHGDDALGNLCGYHVHIVCASDHFAAWSGR